MSFDEYYKEIAIYLALTTDGAEYHLKGVCERYEELFTYRSNSGIKEIQLKELLNFSELYFLEDYYG